jgi:hypothetical protein
VIERAEPLPISGLYIEGRGVSTIIRDFAVATTPSTRSIRRSSPCTRRPIGLD